MVVEHDKTPVLSNPKFPCPLEILKQLVSLPVRYYGFDKKYHNGCIEINQLVSEDVKEFFDLANSLQFPLEKVVAASDPEFHWNDDNLMSANASSGFNYRLISGTNQISLHGQGLAFDINPQQNPYVRYKNDNLIVKPKNASWNMSKTGTLFNEHPLVKFMLDRGWEWGGNWTKQSGRIDYQHFQKLLDN